jgi:hypothetical protein
MDENVVSQLNGQIRRELEKNFKSIDQEVISYLIGNLENKFLKLFKIIFKLCIIRRNRIK